MMFFIAGKPQGKGRARSTKRGVHYTPKHTRDYERTIGIIALAAMKGKEPSAMPIELVITAYFPIPTSVKVKDRPFYEGAMQTGRPDIDNIIKAVTDGLNGIAYRDDAQICRVVAEKRYSQQVGVSVEVSDYEGEL